MSADQQNYQKKAGDPWKKSEAAKSLKDQNSETREKVRHQSCE